MPFDRQVLWQKDVFASQFPVFDLCASLAIASMFFGAMRMSLTLLIEDRGLMKHCTTTTKATVPHEKHRKTTTKRAAPHEKRKKTDRCFGDAEQLRNVVDFFADIVRCSWKWDSIFSLFFLLCSDVMFVLTRSIVLHHIWCHESRHKDAILFVSVHSCIAT